MYGSNLAVTSASERDATSSPPARFLDCGQPPLYPELAKERVEGEPQCDAGKDDGESVHRSPRYSGRPHPASSAAVSPTWLSDSGRQLHHAVVRVARTGAPRPFDP